MADDNVNETRELLKILNPEKINRQATKLADTLSIVEQDIPRNLNDLEVATVASHKEPPRQKSGKKKETSKKKPRDSWEPRESHEPRRDAPDRGPDVFPDFLGPAADSDGKASRASRKSGKSGRRSKKKKRKKLRKKRKIAADSPIILSESELSSAISDLGDKRDEYDQEFIRTDEDRLLRQKDFYIREINKFAQYAKKYDVPRVSRNDSIEYLKCTMETLNFQRQCSGKMKIYHFCIKGLAKATEYFGKKLGFASLEGFSQAVDKQIDEFNEHFYDMTRPIEEFDEEKGEVVIKPNPSFINKISVAPEYNFLLHFFMLMTTYMSMNTFTSYLDIVQKAEEAEEVEDVQDAPVQSDTENEVISRHFAETPRQSTDLPPGDHK